GWWRRRGCRRLRGRRRDRLWRLRTRRPGVDLVGQRHIMRTNRVRHVLDLVPVGTTVLRLPPLDGSKRRSDHLCELSLVLAEHAAGFRQQVRDRSGHEVVSSWWAAANERRVAVRVATMAAPLRRAPSSIARVAGHVEAKAPPFPHVAASSGMAAPPFE